MSTSADHGKDLFRLVYVSRAVLPVLAKFDQTVQEIHAQAQSHNPRMDVTSVLLAHRGWFIQTLEGPRRNVSILFTAIGRDQRHAQIELLGGGRAGERLFGDCAMCAHKITPEAEHVLAAVGLNPDFDPFQVDGAKALELMRGIAGLSSDKTKTAA